MLLGVLPWMVRQGYHPFLIFNLTFGVAQRTRNTWPGIIGHFIGNAFLIIAMAQHALGR